MRVHRLVVSIESFDTSAPDPSDAHQLQVHVWDGQDIVASWYGRTSPDADEYADELKQWLSALLRWEVIALTTPVTQRPARVLAGSRPTRPTRDWSPDHDLPG